MEECTDTLRKGAGLQASGDSFGLGFRAPSGRQAGCFCHHLQVFHVRGDGCSRVAGSVFRLPWHIYIVEPAGIIKTGGVVPDPLLMQ